MKKLALNNRKEVNNLNLVGLYFIKQNSKDLLVDILEKPVAQVIYTDWFIKTDSNMVLLARKVHGRN